MRFVLLLALVGCNSPGPLCYEWSTSPDGRYRLEARGNGSSRCRREGGYVVLREVESGKVLDEVRSDSLDLRSTPGWWSNAVDFEIREHSLHDMVSTEITFKLP